MKSVKTAAKLLALLFTLAVLTACILLLSLSASAETVDSGDCGDNLTWTLDDQGTLTIAGSGDMWGWGYWYSPWSSYGNDIQDIIFGDGVTNIGDSAFRDCTSLTSVTIPDSVTGIGDRAFAYCSSLTSVTIPNSVTSIGDSAFSYCSSLTSVTIGDSVTNIGERAFEYCYKLVEVINHSPLPITAGSDDDSYVSYYAKEVHTGESKIVNQNGYLFCSYDGTNYLLGYAGTDTDLLLPDDYQGESYEIYQYAFYQCTSLTSVTISGGVTSIGEYAFYECSSLTSVTVGNGVTSIGDCAFDYCYKLVEVINHSSLPIETGDWNHGYISYYALEVHTGESKIVDQNGFLFYSYDGINYLLGYTGVMTDLVLPNDYQGTSYAIYSYAFCECPTLVSVTIPDNVTSIGYSAFARCYSLANVTIGSGVVNVSAETFDCCTYLTNISVATGNPFYCSVDGILYSADKTVLVCCPAGKTGSVTIPDSVKTIGWWSFAYCSLKNVTIPSSVICIGSEAFYACDSLVRITISNYVSDMGWGVICGCHSLKHIYCEAAERPDGWDEEWCYNCDAIVHWGKIEPQDIYLNESLSITNGTEFRFIPTESGIYRFYTTDSDGDPYGSLYDADNTLIANDDDSNGDSNYLMKCELIAGHTYYFITEFYSTGSSCTVHLDMVKQVKWSFDNGVLTVYAGIEMENYGLDNLPPWYSKKDEITSVIIEDGVTTIGNRAFQECDAIKCVTIGNEVTHIGEWAFGGCDSLINIIIPDNVIFIGKSAFEECYSLVSVTIGANVCDIGNYAFYGCRKLVEVINHSALSITAGDWGNGLIAEYAKEVHTGESKIVDQSGLLFYSFDGTNFLLGYTGTSTELVLPADYKGEYYEIYVDAFRNFAEITDVTISSGVTSIGDSAFANCTSLVSVTIPDSITSIGEDAFINCCSLVTVIIPDSVTHIGAWAFTFCTALSDIYCEASEQPAQWESVWNADCSATVHWGWKGEETIPGDINGDKLLSIMDVTALLQALAKHTGSTFNPLYDLNTDNTFSIMDVTKLLQMLAKAA